MSVTLQLRHQPHRHVEVVTGAGALLWRYVYQPDTPANEAPRPYAHPVKSLDGDVLTNFRPHDHPWHHGLSFTLTSVSGVNFWGGPTYSAETGYQWRDNHGAQVHRAWTDLRPERMEEVLDWIEQSSGRLLLHERRILGTEVNDGGWRLRWHSELLNVSGSDLVFGNYESPAGLPESHYTGLQFRGARDLLDDCGDAGIGIRTDDGHAGEEQVHGSSAPVMEWSCRHDGSLRRSRIRFASDGTVRWFVRRSLPLAAFSFHGGAPLTLPAGGTHAFEHTIDFLAG